MTVHTKDFDVLIQKMNQFIAGQSEILDALKKLYGDPEPADDLDPDPVTETDTGVEEDDQEQQDDSDSLTQTDGQLHDWGAINQVGGRRYAPYEAWLQGLSPGQQKIMRETFPRAFICISGQPEPSLHAYPSANDQWKRNRQYLHNKRMLGHGNDRNHDGIGDYLIRPGTYAGNYFGIVYPHCSAQLFNPAYKDDQQYRYQTGTPWGRATYQEDVDVEWTGVFRFDHAILPTAKAWLATRLNQGFVPK